MYKIISQVRVLILVIGAVLAVLPVKQKQILPAKCMIKFVGCAYKRPGMKAIFTQTTNISMLLTTDLTTICSILPCYYFAVICSWFRCHECVYDEQCPPDQFCLNRYNPFQDNECATKLHNGLWCNRDAMCKSGKFVTDSLSCSCLFICKRI